MDNIKMQQQLQEVQCNYNDNLAANWDTPQSVQFSLKELNVLQAAVIGECRRYYAIYGKYDESMRALMRKINDIIVSIEVEIRDSK